MSPVWIADVLVCLQVPSDQLEPVILLRSSSKDGIDSIAEAITAPLKSPSPVVVAADEARHRENPFDALEFLHHRVDIAHGDGPVRPELGHDGRSEQTFVPVVGSSSNTLIPLSTHDAILTDAPRAVVDAAPLDRATKRENAYRVREDQRRQRMSPRARCWVLVAAREPVVTLLRDEQAEGEQAEAEGEEIESRHVYSG